MAGINLQKRKVLLLLALCTSRAAASPIPETTFTAFSRFNNAANFHSQNNGFETKAIFSSTSDFFDPSLSDVFGSDFPDAGLGLDYDYDEGFTLNGICDSFCQEARAQATQFENNVRQFEAQFGDGQNSFPSLPSGGGFDGGSFAAPTARPGARPTVAVTPFTAFPKVDSSRPQAPAAPKRPARPTPRQATTTRRPSAAPTQVVVTRRPAPTLRRRTTTRRTTAAPTRPPTTRPTIPTQEKPKSADLPTTRRPPATTGSPVVWSFNGESLGEEGNDREGRTTKKQSPPASTSGPVDSKDLPVDSFFSAGDPSDKKRGKDGADGPLFSVFDAVPK